MIPWASLISSAVGFVSDLSWVWKLAGVVALLAALFFGGCNHGKSIVQAKWETEKQAQAAAALKQVAARADATVNVVTKYVERRIAVKERGAEIVKEVPVYVPYSSACRLPGGWRLLHDAAASGVLPDPARRADAAPVTAADAATTVAANYAKCHETAEQLTALQAWVRAQEQISNAR